MLTVTVAAGNDNHPPDLQSNMPNPDGVRGVPLRLKSGYPLHPRFGSGASMLTYSGHPPDPVAVRLSMFFETLKLIPKALITDSPLLGGRLENSPNCINNSPNQVRHGLT